jgi:hypothetical protein
MAGPYRRIAVADAILQFESSASGIHQRDSVVKLFLSGGCLVEGVVVCGTAFGAVSWSTQVRRAGAGGC